MTDEVDLGEIDERSAAEEASYKRAQSRMIIAGVKACWPSSSVPRKGESATKDGGLNGLWLGKGR
ncbi:MAG TPA: hypothetical protein VF244_07055 [Acidimicrobiales bacterium]